MRTSIAVAVVLLALAASPAEAQWRVARRGPVAVGMPSTVVNGTSYVNPTSYSTRTSSPGRTAYLPTVATYGRVATIVYPDGGYLPPYSGYVLPAGYPSRHYRGYGSDDFPFHGERYGKPNDAWSWPYLGGGYSRDLARYYSPPLGN